jgi:phosphoribosyl-ATP pyrophosphohydrolase
MAARMDTLSRLEQVIAQRFAASADESYVAQLHARGIAVIARKLGEEATETIIAALTGTDEEVVGEAADVLFHLLVLLAEKQIPLAHVFSELDRRQGTSGIAEKASRSQ